MANKNTKKNNYPKNVGIIMDGNGRWALKNSLKIKSIFSPMKKIIKQGNKLQKVPEPIFI